MQGLPREVRLFPGGSSVCLGPLLGVPLVLLVGTCSDVCPLVVLVLGPQGWVSGAGGCQSLFASASTRPAYAWVAPICVKGLASSSLELGVDL